MFRFAPEEAANVERVFDLAKQDVAGYEAYADQIAALLKDDRKLLQHVLEGLMYVAAADGVLHPKEDAFLKAVASALRLLRQRVPLLPRPLRHRSAATPTTRCASSPDATDAEVKAQYRKLVRDNHPDRLMANGVPAEFIELANRKLAAINAAYDTIARERGL